MSGSTETRYVPVEFPDWSDRPWAFPGILWRLPYWPIRLYMHAGDRALFWLWYNSRGFVWALEDRMGADSSYTDHAHPEDTGL